MQALADIEAKRVKRLVLKGKSKNALKKFVKAILDDLAVLRVEVEARKGRSK